MISENRRSELRDRLAELNRARAKIEELAREHEISIGEARALMEMMGDDPAQLEATAETLRRLKRSTAI